MRKKLNLYVNFSKKYDFYLLKYFEYTLASRFYCSGIHTLSIRRLNKNKKICYCKGMELAEKFYAAVRLIPRGKVVTYSHIAALVGNCNLRRYVGNALHKNPSNAVTPCHRVVNAKGFCSGSFAFGGPDVQQKKLEAEGVGFVDGHVDMERFEITPDDFEMMRAGLV